ncbi:TPA: ABC transporter substrate-binding protein, partial [Candidatus Poribacteria bacterium]|nr:ABC transporter substrate-binding protein [Candidatus Poribacteria bacterium]
MLFKLFSLISLILSLGFAVDIVVGNTLIFGRGGDSVGLDPAHEEDGESFKVCENIYDT